MSTAQPLGPPVVGVNQPGLQGQESGGFPPDTTGAIGPLNYLEFVNSRVAVYDRNLALVASTDLASFVGFPGGNTGDPQILFAPTANRWFYASDLSVTALLFGWSKTADPTDLVNGWCQFGIDTGVQFHDFPKLGGDNNFIAIGTNVFVGGLPVTSSIWAISKPAVDDATCALPTSVGLFGTPSSPLLNADGSHAFTPVPANSTDSNPTCNIVAAHDAEATPQTMVMAWHLMQQPDGSPALVADGDMTVDIFSRPARAPQPGVPFLLFTSDSRITQAVGHADPDAAGAQAVWAQHTVDGPGGRSVVRWYEFLPSTLTVRQQGEIQSATDFVFNGAISPSIDGNSAAIFYNRSSASTLPLIATQSRLSTTPLGTMDPGEVVLGNSVDALQDLECSTDTRVCRWGDYAGATPDPAVPGVVWGTNELSGAADPFIFLQWTTRNYSVTT